MHLKMDTLVYYEYRTMMERVIGCCGVKRIGDGVSPVAANR